MKQGRHDKRCRPGSATAPTLISVVRVGPTNLILFRNKMAVLLLDRSIHHHDNVDTSSASWRSKTDSEVPVATSNRRSCQQRRSPLAMNLSLNPKLVDKDDAQKLLENSLQREFKAEEQVNALQRTIVAHVHALVSYSRPQIRQRG